MGVYWVIGGTSGSGKMTDVELRKQGHHTVVSGEEIDVRQEWQLDEFLNQPEMQDLTGVVYCAGINYLSWIGQADMVSMRNVVNVNLVGFMNLMNVLVGKFGKAEIQPLRVLALSSDAAERPLRTSMAYCASKAGLNMAVRVAARELGPKGWRINALSPGMLDGTHMSKYVDKKVLEIRDWTYMEMMDYEISQEVVPGRIDVGEVAQMAVQILRGPDHLNGSIITMNGGR